jgi:hypothetical protein
MSFGFLVINISNHGEYFETPFIFPERDSKFKVLLEDRSGALKTNFPISQIKTLRIFYYYPCYLIIILPVFVQ